MPRIEALAAVHGDQVCTNDDLIRNAAYNWSPMSAEEIRDKTGIEQRLYTTGSLEDIALQAAQRALDHAGRGPEDIGAVLVCTCTSTQMIPSIATWMSGQLGIQQTHGSYDIVAACAGMAYGLLDVVRILQEVKRPVLMVCAEKFSDKIGNVRTSRMIFGDGAAAMVIGVAPQGVQTDIEYLQAYASGPATQVNSIIWPNPAFDNNITVFGPEVKALAGRYLVQMIEELRALPDPDGQAASLLDSVDLVVPHQANKTMVSQLATKAGLSLDSVYFNIAQVGNASSASIPLAIHDAVRDRGNHRAGPHLRSRFRSRGRRRVRRHAGRPGDGRHHEPVPPPGAARSVHNAAPARAVLGRHTPRVRLGKLATCDQRALPVSGINPQNSTM